MGSNITMLTAAKSVRLRALMKITRRACMFSTMAGVVCVVFGAAAYILFGAYDEIVTGLCGTTICHVILAPGGKASAVTFERDCGATTSFSTQISIVPSGAVFSAEKYPALFAVRGNRDIIPHWHGENEITIDVPRSEEVYRSESHSNGVTIDYE
jgi:hypothetical protein